MKTKIFLTALFLTVAGSLLYGQESKQTTMSGITHPWWVVDRGGGKSSNGDSIFLQSSIGQTAIQRMVHIDTGMILESGYIPGLRKFSGSYTTVSLPVQDSWNLISVPLIVSDYQKSILFPTAKSDAFGYSGSYVQVNTLNNSIGYWLKFTPAQSVSIMGTAFTLDTVDVSGGWNMIGPPSFPVLVSEVEKIPSEITLSRFFGYKENYYEEDTLKPGFGYWVKTSSACKLVFKSGSVLISTTSIFASSEQNKLPASTEAMIAEENNFNSLTFSDGSKSSKVLYFSATPVEVDLEQLVLPPSPPGEVFDVRFGTQRIIEAVQGINRVIHEFPIRIVNAKNLLTIQPNIGLDDNDYSLEIKFKGNEIIKYSLKQNENINIDPSKIITAKLIINLSSGKELPSEFALHQNYPNPFNPSTKIKYDLPKEAKVVLKIYNVLGQEMKVLVDDIQHAGFKSVEWNGSEYPSGVYIYKMIAESESNYFIQVKKLVLLK